MGKTMCTFARLAIVIPQFSHISPILDGRNMGEIWEKWGISSEE